LKLLRKEKDVHDKRFSPLWSLNPLGVLVPEGSQEGGVEGDCLVLVYFIMKDWQYNPLLTSPY
jgi:hypothetical protein